MKLLLIIPKYPVYLRVPSLPLGPISIASYLNAHGHSVRILDRSVHKSNIIHNIASFSPDIIGISVMSFLSGIDAKKITSQIRNITKVPIVWGGQNPTALPEMMIREAGIDFIVFGEGEKTWLDILDSLEQKNDVYNIPGIVYMKNDKLIKNEERELMDLTDLPDLDWSLVNIEEYFSAFLGCTKMLYLYASKGCIGSCTFCSNAQLHHCKNRCRSPEQIIKDIDYFYEHGANAVYFGDELFIPNRKVRNRLCELILERNYNITWGCMTRLGILNKDDIQFMYKAGCRWILFGIESGSQERINAIKKNIDLSLAPQTIKWCMDAGITTNAAFIIGFPGETFDETKKTIQFANSLHSSLVQMNILVPFPNSELVFDIEQKGIFSFPNNIKSCAKLIDRDVGDRVVTNLSNIPDIDLKVLHFYYQWIAFIDKKSVQNDSFGIIKKFASDTFNRMFKHGIKGFIYGTILSVRQFLTVFFYANFFPDILKKYGCR